MQEIGTVSSERLAELAGVNAAKVRKDLSYLGSYGTRGVGYDVEYLLHEISRELGLTHDWPVAIVGVGNLGQALANYRGFGARGFRIVALVDADPEKVGQTVGDLTIESLDDLPDIARERGVAIGIIATPAHAAQEVADRLVDAGVTSILNFAPTVVTAPTGVSLRKVDLAIELQILSFYQQRRDSAPTLDRVAQRRGRRSRGTMSDEPPVGRPAITGYPVEPRRRRPALRRGRRRSHRRPQDRGPARRRGRRARGRARRRRRGARLGRGRPAGRVRAGVRARRPRRRLARDHRHRRCPRSTTRCSRRARPAGSG